MAAHTYDNGGILMLCDVARPKNKEVINILYMCIVWSVLRSTMNVQDLKHPFISNLDCAVTSNRPVNREDLDFQE